MTEMTVPEGCTGTAHADAGLAHSSHCPVHHVGREPAAAIILAASVDTSPAPRTYWALTEHYTIGTAFVTRSAAIAEAARKLERLLGENETSDRLNVLRQAVDERVADKDGDRIAKRIFVTIEVKS